jgi:Ca2+-binding RTX toxin-like protein
MGMRGRISLMGAATLVALLVVAPTGAGAATLGQLGTPEENCFNPDPFDVVQPTVTSGNSYVAPTDGTITSWSHNAGDEAGQMLEMKMFRHVSGTTYRVVGHDGPHPITPNTINTFSGFSIPVKAGDVLGLNDHDTFACVITATGGDQILERFGDLADGESGAFTPRTSGEGIRANISAQFESLYRCGGREATLAGTAGRDTLVGTDGKDVIAGLEGKDKIKGLGGKDRICGGKGKDKLKGGAANDRLKGGKGRDKLTGGGGRRDKCAGGKGDDTAKKCEIEKSL